MKSAKIRPSVPASVKLSVFDGRGKSFRALNAKHESVDVAYEIREGWNDVYPNKFCKPRFYTRKYHVGNYYPCVPRL